MASLNMGISVHQHLRCSCASSDSSENSRRASKRGKTNCGGRHLRVMMKQRKGSELDALDDVIRGLKLFLLECAAREVSPAHAE